MSARRNLLWLVPLGLFVSSPFWKPSLTDFLRPRGGFDPDFSVTATRQKEQFVMDEITITLNTAGREEWLINAERAFTGKNDRELGMIEVHALYKGGEEPISIDSRRGTYFIDQRHLILIDNVVIRKPRAGEELYTDLLHYYDTTKMVISPVDVEIRGPRFTLQAGRMDYDLTTDGYDFSGGVNVEL